MIKKVITQAIFLSLIFLAAASQGETLGNDFQCGNRLVSVGDRKFEVLTKCGEPTLPGCETRKAL